MIAFVNNWLQFLHSIFKWFLQIYPQEKIENKLKVSNSSPRPTSVNYHFTRQCNYKCRFCFHTAKSSFVLPLEEAMRGLRLLREAGMEKINFSGGEPFIHQKGRYLGHLVQFCKRELGLASVSIVSNGSLITEDWFIRFGEHLDILAISCDSFRPETNNLIGRHRNSNKKEAAICEDDDEHLESLERVRGWCRDYRVAFKINSVINAHNFDEDMNKQIRQLNPVRWKVFQCLLIGGENHGKEALRDAEKLVVTDQQFESFLQRHREVACLVPESNVKMRNSYLILDERMRFLDCMDGRKTPSPSLLDVGVEAAIQASGFDEAMFFQRGGKYVWSKSDMSPSLLEW
ncbi:hypothetical protein GHT06_010167 [Daphnia sinensis]|uniref:S-adenosylmethionine-dependent nucleotide dehydratase RSAD2 n=1 Tax=Daphnia sinensis TaxID=1820382 RepID=A0AAD5LRM5_9CRUS|nr:hypothetical protein GHT06_010167 [Daphnia sinensis]